MLPATVDYIPWDTNISEIIKLNKISGMTDSIKTSFHLSKRDQGHVKDSFKSNGVCVGFLLNQIIFVLACF